MFQVTDFIVVARYLFGGCYILMGDRLCQAAHGGRQEECKGSNKTCGKDKRIHIASRAVCLPVNPVPPGLTTRAIFVQPFRIDLIWLQHSDRS
jgi:hypothetical protein